MNSNQKNSALSGFALGLIGLCFLLLLREIVITRQLWAEIPRIVAGFMVPVPAAVFLAFCLADRSGSPMREPSPGFMLGLLIGSFSLTIALGVWLGGGSAADGSINTGPAIAESSVFSASLLNFLFFRSQILAALLSGVSVGLTTVVIFLI